MSFREENTALYEIKPSPNKETLMLKKTIVAAALTAVGTFVAKLIVARVRAEA